MEIVGEVSMAETDDVDPSCVPEIYLSLWQSPAFSKHLVIPRRPTQDMMVAVQRSCANGSHRRRRKPETLAQFATILWPRERSHAVACRLCGCGSMLTLVGIYGVLALSVLETP